MHASLFPEMLVNPEEKASAREIDIYMYKYLGCVQRGRESTVLSQQALST